MKKEIKEEINYIMNVKYLTDERSDKSKYMERTISVNDKVLYSDFTILDDNILKSETIIDKFHRWGINAFKTVNSQ